MNLGQARDTPISLDGLTGFFLNAEMRYEEQNAFEIFVTALYAPKHTLSHVKDKGSFNFNSKGRMIQSNNIHANDKGVFHPSSSNDHSGSSRNWARFPCQICGRQEHSTIIVIIT